MKQNKIGLKPGFYVNFNKGGTIKELYKFSEGELYTVLKGTSSNTTFFKIPYSYSNIKIPREVNDWVLITSTIFDYLLEIVYLPGKNLRFLGSLVTNETFNDKVFLSLLEKGGQEIQKSKNPKLLMTPNPVSGMFLDEFIEKSNISLENAIKEVQGVPANSIYSGLDFGEIKKKPNTDSSDAIKYGLTPLATKVKNKTKFILYNGVVEIITGYSLGNVKTTSEKLMHAIDKGKHIMVFNENQEMIAFYNQKVVSEFSFSIYKLE